VRQAYERVNGERAGAPATLLLPGGYRCAPRPPQAAQLAQQAGRREP